LFSMGDSYIFRPCFKLIYPELDFYSKRYSGREAKSLNSGSLSAGFSEWQLIRQDNRANLLCELIYSWSKRFNLGAEWCCEYAIMTLRLANILNQSKEIVNTRDHYSYLWSFLADAIITIWPKLKMLPIFPDIYPTLEPPQDLPIWKPGLETRSSYLSRVEQQVRNHLDGPILRLLKSKLRADVIEQIKYRANDYCEKVSKCYLQPFWRKVKVKPRLERDVCWAVQFQVLKKSYLEIATVSGVEPSTVKRAVEDTLEHVGLGARKSHRGRPSKRKASVSAKINRNSSPT
jgi:hypothetical protein